MELGLVIACGEVNDVKHLRFQDSNSVDDLLDIRNVKSEAPLLRRALRRGLRDQVDLTPLRGLRFLDDAYAQ